MRLDCEAIAGLPCLEEALDSFHDAGLLNFVTDKEHWNEELLLQFFFEKLDSRGKTPSATILCYPPHSRLQQGSEDLGP